MLLHGKLPHNPKFQMINSAGFAAPQSVHQLLSSVSVACWQPGTHPQGCGQGRTALSLYSHEEVPGCRAGVADTGLESLGTCTPASNLSLLIYLFCKSVIRIFFFHRLPAYVCPFLYDCSC